MRFTREILREMLDADDTALVHGTSVEACLALIQKGRLQKEYFSTFKPTPRESDYLFFMPNIRFFREGNHPLCERIKGLQYFGDALHEGEVYAKSCAFEHFLAFQLGESPKICYPEYRDYDEEPVTRFLRQAKRKGILEIHARNLLQEAGKRKGVLLGIGEKVFDFEILPAKDLEDEVCIFLPEGLDGKYVNGIVPLGNIERKLLEEFYRR